MTHPSGTDWTEDELARRALLEQGVAVAVNLRRRHNLITASLAAAHGYDQQPSWLR